VSSYFEKLLSNGHSHDEYWGLTFTFTFDEDSMLSSAEAVISFSPMLNPEIIVAYLIEIAAVRTEILCYGHHDNIMLVNPTCGYLCPTRKTYVPQMQLTTQH